MHPAVSIAPPLRRRGSQELRAEGAQDALGGVGGRSDVWSMKLMY